jgi:hypothetical protein
MQDDRDSKVIAKRTADPAASSNAVLSSFTSLILRRDFENAAKLELKLDHSNLIDLLSMIRYHEMRGAVSVAYRIAHERSKCWQPSSPNSEHIGSDYVTAFDLCGAYLRCRIEGRWVEAMRTALNTLESLGERCELGSPLEPVSSLPHSAVTLTHLYYWE